jgi:hypothetical protein
MVKQLKSVPREPPEEETVQRNLLPVTKERRKLEYATDWGEITDSIRIDTQYTIEVVRSTPAQGEAPVAPGTIIVPKPPQLERTNEAKL